MIFFVFLIIISHFLGVISLSILPRLLIFIIILNLVLLTFLLNFKIVMLLQFLNLLFILFKVYPSLLELIFQVLNLKFHIFNISWSNLVFRLLLTNVLRIWVSSLFLDTIIAINIGIIVWICIWVWHLSSLLIGIISMKFFL